jgi:RNA polymerase sigma-70 factor (ECF subfamily)
MTYAALVAAPPLVLVTEANGDEPSLVVRAQQQDVRAFEQLYRLHVRRIYALCLRMTANVSRAEELTQKAFLVAWQKLTCFRGESAFASWLHRIAVNTVLADLRAEQRRTRRVFSTDDLTAYEMPLPAAPAGTHLDLDEAIAALPPQARVVFVLHDIEGWQHDEIARELGVASGTSKAQLHRARKLLQQALQ